MVGSNTADGRFILLKDVANECVYNKLIVGVAMEGLATGNTTIYAKARCIPYYSGKFLQSIIFVNFVACVKFIYKNQIMYMVHTLFWINSRIFYPVKISHYTVYERPSKLQLMHM